MDTVQTQSTDEVLAFLESQLPNARSSLELADTRKWTFPLDKKVKTPSGKNTKKKKPFLTRKERKKLELLKLPKEQWKHDQLEGIRTLWKEYMRKNLSLYPSIPKMTDSNWSNFNVTLAKSEFVGAVLTVVRSKVANQVGMTGTVVLETKSTFQIVTVANELKTLIKKPSVFCFVLDNSRFTIFGKHMGIRPNERSVKKLKLRFLPDL